MFMCYRGDKVLQEGVTDSLVKLAQNHPYSVKIMKEFVLKYGEKEHKISKSSVVSEVRRFEELAKVLDVKQE